MNKPETILKEWLKAVNVGEVKNILAMYNESAVLIPTFSNRILNTPEKICDYFEQLYTLENLSVSLHENLVNTQRLTENIYALSGIYCWRFKIDGELLNFEARFSYLFDFSLTSPIIHHHSSQIPRML